MPSHAAPRHRMIFHSALNLVGLVAPFAAALFAIPILNQRAGVERLGLLSLCWALLGYFSLFDAGLGRALIKFVSARIAEGRIRDLGSLVVTAMVMMFVLSLLGAGVLVAVSRPLVDHMLGGERGLQAEALTSMHLLAIAIPMVILTSALRGVLEALHRFDLTNALRVPMGLWNFLGPMAVVYYSPSLVPIVAVLVVGRLLFLALHLWFCAIAAPGLWSNPTIERSLIKPLLTFGGWMTLSNILAPLMMYLDRFVVGNQLGAAAIAYYSTPSEISSRCTLVSDALLSVLYPTFSHLLVSDELATRSLYRKSLETMTSVMFPIALIGVALAPEFITWWLKDEEFTINSAPVLRIMMLAMFINTQTRVTCCLIQAAGRPDLIARLHFIEFPLYVAALLFGIAYAGLPGAACAWLFRVILDFALQLVIGQKVFPLGGDALRRFLLITVVCTGLIILVWALPGLVPRLLIAGLLGAASALALYRLGRGDLRTA